MAVCIDWARMRRALDPIPCRTRVQAGCGWKKGDIGWWIAGGILCCTVLYGSYGVTLDE